MKTAKFIISKEEMASMPVVSFPGKITVIETVEAGIEALRELSEAETVGFDTETKPAFRKGQLNNVALIQVATLTASYLFRVNKTGLFHELKEFMESDAVKKVGLSVKDDFKVLRRIEPFSPGGFIDLQSEVASYGIGDGSLQKIYAIMFGERISKGQRLSNWETAHLSDAQCSYASIDAWACLKIYNALLAGQFGRVLVPHGHRLEE